MQNTTPYIKEHHKNPINLNMGYHTCSVCMNDMVLVKTYNGDYWICKVCNNTEI